MAARAHPRLPVWLLLLPVSFLLHIAEEWWGGEGFSAWTARAVGSPVSTTRFLVVNSIAWSLSALLTVLAVSRGRVTWFPAAFATVILVNSGLHLLGSAATSSYSPGLITSVLLYVPLGLLSLGQCRKALEPSRFSAGVAIGVLIHAVVIVIALA